MKKNAILLYSLGLLLLASCSGNKEQNAPNTITFWHFWSEPSQEKVIKEIIADFEKQEHCTINATALSWGDGKTKLLAAFNSGKAPDVLELGSDWVAQFSSANVLRELNDTNDRKRFSDFSLAPAMFSGKQFALPWVVDTRVLFYNKNLMKKAGLSDAPPATMSEMLNLAEKIQQFEGADGFGANGSDPHRLYKKFLPFVWSNGGDIFDSSGNPSLNSTANIEALNMYVSLSRAGRIETQRELDAAFVQGKIGFWFSGGWLTQKIEAGNPSLNYGVALVPAMKQPGMSFAGGEYLAINAKSSNQQLAEKFIRYLSDGKIALNFCKKNADAGFPADKSTFNDAYFNTAKNRSIFAQQLAHAKMTPVQPRWLDIESIIENAVVEALYGQKTAAQALADAQTDVTAILK